MEQPSEQKLTGLRKRQQIQKTNRTILLWVAVASIVVSVALVLLQFLVRQALLNNKVIGAKAETYQTLKQNIENAKTLKVNVNKLIADDSLSSARANESDSNLKVILDALPSTSDATTFANSLQNSILSRSGVKIDGLSAGDSAALAMAAIVLPTAGADTPQPIPFTSDVTGDYLKIQTLLVDIERVIRPIQIKTLSITGSDNALSVRIGGVTYYSPEKTVKLGTQSIQP